MGRIMAMDYGTKRIGLAVTDPLQIIASPLDTISTDQIFVYLNKFIDREGIDCLVIGAPMHKDGTPTFLESHIQQFIEKFSKQYPTIKIDRINEAFSSSMAEEVIRKTVKKKKDRRDKALVDQISACILLQDYMASI